MAYYLVSGKADPAKLAELKARLESGEIRSMQPFGRALDHALSEARVGADGVAVWEEEDYCRPPLAMERAAVLDSYFTNLSVEQVSKGAGRRRVETLSSLWKGERAGKPGATKDEQSIGRE